MDNNNLKMQQKNLFQLIETWDLTNIKLALQIIKKNPDLKDAVEQRYLPIIHFVGGKSLQGLKTLPQKFADRKLYRKEWTPGPSQIEVLGSFAVGSLNLYRYKFKQLPDWICHVKGITELHLSKNELTSLPQQIGNLDQVTTINLHNNELTTLPDSICKMTSLEYLTLNGNQIERLPDNIGQLKQLKNLSISQYKTIELPESFGELANLESLCISCNEERPIVFPKHIKELVRLETLILRTPNLNTVPEWIAHASQLKDLRLAYSNIKVLPEFIGNLSKLEKLYISGNPFQELPHSLTQLTHLTELYLSNTPYFEAAPEGKLIGRETITTFFQEIGLT